MDTSPHSNMFIHIQSFAHLVCQEVPDVVLVGTQALDTLLLPDTPTQTIDSIDTSRLGRKGSSIVL